MRFVLWLLVALSHVAVAAPWTPDPTFGKSGVAATSFGTFVDPATGAPLPSHATRVIALPDGKLLAMAAQQTVPYATGGSSPGEWARVIARYNADGTLDRSLAGSGSIILPTQSNVPGATLAVQDDGKFVVADPATKDFQTFIALSRFHPDGSRDVDFGADGVAVANLFPNYTLEATHTLLARDGSIVVVGNAIAKFNVKPAVVRFTPSGQLDAAFGSGGMIVLDVPAPPGLPKYYATRAVEQPDGKLVVAGWSPNGSGRAAFALAIRLSTGGTLDRGFGTDGFAMIPMGQDGALTITSIARGPDGKLVLGGSRTSASIEPLLLRLTASGTLDTSFGTAGVTVGIPGHPSAEIVDLLAQGDGRLVAFNSVEPQYNVHAGAFLSRYDQHGFIDTSFGVDGILKLDGFGRAGALAQQADGKWIAGGALAPGTPAEGPYNQPFALTRIVPGAQSVIEYYRADVDHYFVTSNPLEIADLDRGIHPGWTRTGQAFQVFGSADAATVPAKPVCRFYIPPSRGDSHFFSVSAAECAAVDALTLTDPNYAGYVYETPKAFFASMPDTTTGACAGGSKAVYRVWNSRVDSNHRYTIDRTIRDAMVAKGWIAEGYGPMAVAMCSAP